MNKLISITAIGCILAMSSCTGNDTPASGNTSDDAIHNKIDSKYAPMERNHPEKLLHVYGKKSPSFSLALDLIVASTSPTCQVVESSLVGAHDQSFGAVITVQQTETTYDATVDKFEPGTCGWFPNSLNFVISKGVSKTPNNALVWISTEENRNPSFAQNGWTSMPPFDETCDQALHCSQPRGQYYLSSDAKELNVNFVEGK